MYVGMVLAAEFIEEKYNRTADEPSYHVFSKKIKYSAPGLVYSVVTVLCLAESVGSVD